MKGFADTFTYSFFACEVFVKGYHKSVNVKSLLIFRTAVNNIAYTNLGEIPKNLRKNSSYPHISNILFYLLF